LLVVARMKLLGSLALVAILASPSIAGGARSPTVADRLDVAAARSAIADLSATKRALDDGYETNLLDLAVAQLAHAGDLDDVRALVADADSTNPRLDEFLVMAQARLGDRAPLEAHIAVADRDRASWGKRGPGISCQIAMIYELLGDTANADARLADAHADCPTYLAGEETAAGHVARARAILDAAKPPSDPDSARLRVMARARAGEADARAAIAELAAKLEHDHAADLAAQLAEFAGVAAAAGWKADAKDLFARAMAAFPGEDDITREATRDDLIAAAAVIDHASAVQLVAEGYPTAAGADDAALELAATAWAKIGERAKAKAILARVSAARRAEGGRWLAETYMFLGQLDLAIAAAAKESGFARVEILTTLATYVREHKVKPTKAITAALATL
jgi:hypothetical protein